MQLLKLGCVLASTGPGAGVVVVGMVQGGAVVMEEHNTKNNRK